ncbi:hypothetical protein COEREDRAFT_98754 [Coemansia reversa NRRL 1564]|uniref:Uncharacterized protein n=1 Tax=Coemansia reversa (strain ATCC 12441 / NRRL 1564) TaxID=763665 RepID=A0A2G5B6F8_COERN|nr:hypothetical protein COEREDRAFT_98754 [Coemansia reversa NRRL 1564]|eukprot:PIA14580.1 hypothetical protein COEREDRAFT_98754 [Coemansia reversa NRRL 1564]
MHALMTIGIVAFLAGAGVLGADGSGKAAHANQLSRADDNTNMPEFIDVGSLVAAASVQDNEQNVPRPTAKIEDVGGAAAQGAKKQIQPPANPAGNRAVVVKESSPQNKDSGSMHGRPAEHNGASMGKDGMNIHPAHRQQPLESSVSAASEVPMTRTVVENKFVTKTVIDRDAVDENDNKVPKKTGSANARGGSSSIVSARRPNQLDKSGSDDEESAAISLQPSAVFGTIFFALIGYITA